MARATLSQGIEVALKEAIPELKGVVDITDHAVGENPYYASRSLRPPVHCRPQISRLIPKEGNVPGRTDGLNSSFRAMDPLLVAAVPPAGLLIGDALEPLA